MIDDAIRSRARELLEDTLYYESRILPTDYRLALIEFLEALCTTLSPIDLLM